MRKKQLNTNEIEIVQPRDFFQIRETECVLTLYEIYINSIAINSENDISELLHCLRSASYNDQIKIYLNNPGGCVVTTFQIINAMQDCQANITTIADGDVSSAATFIFLAGDDQVVNEHCTFLFHGCLIGGTPGLERLSDNIATLDYTKNLMKPFWDRYYAGFFTSDEITRMQNGEDFQLTTSQVKRRLVKRSKFLKTIKT